MPHPAPDIHGYRFENIEIDLRRRELRIDGVVEAVEPRVYELIATLVEGRDRAFGKDALIAQLWNRPVSDASLSQLVYKARRVLGEDDQRRFIETVHGHGFRWLVEVEALRVSPPAVSPMKPVAAATVPAQAAARTPRVWGALALLLVVVVATSLFVQRQVATASGSERRVLVLPVVDRTGDAELAWVRRGLMGLVASVIEQQPGLASPQDADLPQQADSALDDPAQRQRLRDQAGADDVAFLSLARSGTLLRLDVVLESRQGRREETLFGADAAALALDAGRRISGWLGTEASALPSMLAGMEGYLAETYARGIEAYIDGRFEAARNYFSICTEHRPELIWPRLQLATTLLRLGQTTDALRLLADIETSATALTPKQARHVRLRVAAARLAHGDVAAAQRGFAGVREEAEAAGDLRSLRIASDGLGQAAEAVGDHAAAADWFQRVLEMDRRSGDRRREALALANLAALAFNRGDLDNAQRQYMQVTDLARALDLPALRQSSLQSLASTQQVHGRHATAQALHVQALQLARTTGDVQGEAIARIGIATVFAAYGRGEPAQRHAALALALTRDNGLRSEQAYALAAANLAARAAGDANAARRLQTEAVAAFRQMQNWPVLMGQLLRLAREARERGDQAELAQWVEQAAEVTRDHRRAAGVAVLESAVRAQQQAAAGDTAGALAVLDAAFRKSQAGHDALRGRLLALEVGRIALAAGQLARTENILVEIGAARSEDPYAIRLHADWLAASGRLADAEAERTRLAHLAEALQDPDASHEDQI